MKAIGSNYAHLRNVLASKWTARIGTIMFLSLALFFAYPDTSYRSFFRQLLSFMGVSTVSPSGNLIRYGTYVFCLVSGLLLIALFLKKSKDSEWRNEILAVNCAWTAFVLEASLVLGLQWEAWDVWMVMNNTVVLFFWSVIVLSVASVFLLTPYKWARLFGYLVSWAFFIVNIFGLSLALKYLVLHSNPSPPLTAVVVIMTSVAIFSLHREHLVNSRLINLGEGIKENSWGLKGFLTSPKVLSVILALILLPSSVAFFQPYSQWARSDGKTDEFYTGVAFCGRTIEQAKRLIDRVKNFTNVFVVQSLPISYDEAKLNEICDYAVSSGLNIMVYFRYFDEYWQINWLDFADARWGDKFLGVYLYDEPGGLQVDRPEQIGRPRQGLIKTYSDAANWFFNGFWDYRSRSDMRMLKMRSIRAYVSDYALYWFDYKVGYDAVFTQFGWNHSRPLHIALCRGAANMHERDWGVIVTWTYTTPPYIQSGEDLYNDAVLAYDNGASYVLVFNHPYSSNSIYGILEEEHLEAMSEFWEYTRQNSRPKEMGEMAAYVLPKDYGYGLRGPNDKIWGRFEADDLANQICVNLNELLLQYGTRLDVIYEDVLLSNSPATARYKEIFMWNETK